VDERDDRLEHALGVAYRYLNRRERTAGEIRAHLAGRGVDAEAADGAIQALMEHGYLDDARFARVFTQDKRELEQWGGERIMRALLRRGIDRDLVQTALVGDGELDRALALLRRRIARPPGDRRERERALGVLLRKGYEHELALEALARFTHGWH
jgi:regulatory protein